MSEQNIRVQNVTHNSIITIGTQIDTDRKLKLFEQNQEMLTKIDSSDFGARKKIQGISSNTNGTKNSLH